MRWPSWSTWRVNAASIPASVSAPVTLTDSHDDPLVRYDATWVAGLDAAQWPPPPRPDVFIPCACSRRAAFRRPARRAERPGPCVTRRVACLDCELVCSWARLDGDAHRTASPLLLRVEDQDRHATRSRSLAGLARASCGRRVEKLDDSRGVPVNTAFIVPAG
jgi:hypothetical protein